MEMSPYRQVERYTGFSYALALQAHGEQNLSDESENLVMSNVHLDFEAETNADHQDEKQLIERLDTLKGAGVHDGEAMIS